ncbi:hypothetical protein GGF32_002692 [Allomyces javanicus]|nr:hypothetical protein GGF32_002692 [Allomyces javanicus]
MKLSNALLLATATASLAMVALPADAQSISFGGLKFKPGSLFADDKRSYGRPPPPPAKHPKSTIGAPMRWAVSRFATGDAPSAVGSPANTGTPGPSSPTKRPRRRGHGRRRRPRRRNRVRRRSTGRPRRRRRHPGQRRPGQRRTRGRRNRKPTTAGSAQVPSGTVTRTAAASRGGAPGGIREYKAALRRKQQEEWAAEQAWLKSQKQKAQFSLSDGYDYEPFGDEYDEGFSVSEDAAYDGDDAWDDAYDGDGFSFADEAFEDAWDDAYDGEGFSLEEAFEDAADYEY